MQQLLRPESFFRKDKPKIMWWLMPEQRIPALEPNEIILILCYFQLKTVCKWGLSFQHGKKIREWPVFWGGGGIAFQSSSPDEWVKRKLISCSSSEFCHLPARWPIATWFWVPISSPISGGNDFCLLPGTTMSIKLDCTWESTQRKCGALYKCRMYYCFF